MTRPFTPVVIVAQASGPFIVAQASLPAIRLWMFIQRLSMAGRDAHPTVLNLSPYL